MDRIRKAIGSSSFGGMVLLVLLVLLQLAFNLAEFITSMRGHSRYEIHAFLLGALVAWLATYTSLTREKRLVSRIRSDVALSASFQSLHDRSDLPLRYRNLFLGCGDDVVTDKEILAVYQWAKKVEPRTNRAVRLSAETIICEKALGLTRKDAIHALRNSRLVEEIRAHLHNPPDQTSVTPARADGVAS